MTDAVRRRREMIRDKHVFFVDHLQPKFEFLDLLIAKEVFSAEAMEEIRAEKETRKQIAKILQHLQYVEENDYGCFLAALHESNQTYIVNVINGKCQTPSDKETRPFV